MEATRSALESEHKLQLLQMQAINALWKKVVALQPPSGRESGTTNGEGISNSNIDVVTNLAQTCNLLHNQVIQTRFYLLLIRKFINFSIDTVEF